MVLFSRSDWSEFWLNGSRPWSKRVRNRNALTEIAWEDAVQGLGMTMSTVASEKNREMLFIGNLFYNSDITACCFTSVSRAGPPENRKY